LNFVAHQSSSMVGDLMKSKGNPSCFPTKRLWNALKTSLLNYIKNKCKVHIILFCTSWLPQQNHKCIHPSIEHIWSKCEPTQETVRCIGTQELVPNPIAFANWILQLHFQYDFLTPLQWSSCIQAQLACMETTWKSNGF